MNTPYQTLGQITELPTVAKGVARALAGCEAAEEEVKRVMESMGIAPDRVARLLEELPLRLHKRTPDGLNDN